MKNSPSDSGDFAATRWTLVLSAARGSQTPRAAAAAAMAELCRIYWYPLYAFIRRRGHPAPEAEDLTQEFFARLLEKHFLAAVDREKGRFRTFLLMAVKRFLANEHDRAQAQKRGGGLRIVPLEGLEPDTRYRLEPAETLTPERLFEQQWALTLLDQVLARLEAETGGGRGVALVPAAGQMRRRQAIPSIPTGLVQALADPAAYQRRTRSTTAPLAFP